MELLKKSSSGTGSIRARGANFLFAAACGGWRITN
jgi:hypothetical protein